MRDRGSFAGSPRGDSKHLCTRRVRGTEDPTLAEKDNLGLYRRRRRRARRMRAGVVRDEAARRAWRIRR
ncbi:hypothetical protein BCAR13_1230037 [Paraburkholderia caribensis]|nr:hypothetical protein BCAR13_1230037 [Paraburkholderia caribensis]